MRRGLRVRLRAPHTQAPHVPGSVAAVLSPLQADTPKIPGIWNWGLHQWLMRRDRAQSLSPRPSPALAQGSQTPGLVQRPPVVGLPKVHSLLPVALPVHSAWLVRDMEIVGVATDTWVGQLLLWVWPGRFINEIVGVAKRVRARPKRLWAWPWRFGQGQ